MVGSRVNSTITAVCTPKGEGGIAVIRVSGNDAFEITDRIWRGKKLSGALSHTVHLGNIVDSDGSIIDEALATVFAAPNSFTGENVVELSCHGSKWIQRKVVNMLIEAGARAAMPGEFSQRAFLNGRIDLAQAEGIADLISASSAASHKLAMSQLKGKFSHRLNELRGQLIEIASLLELELDFSEEDVEFADRTHLLDLCDDIIESTGTLADSYKAGSALKEGVPVVIAGCPNAGKSSLLNLLLQEEKAIVTDIPGTTRDIIEDKIEVDGILFRFIDTAGLRATDDAIERIGIDRAHSHLRKAEIILWLIDPLTPLDTQLAEYAAFNPTPAQTLLPILNKSDLPASRKVLADLESAILSLDSNESTKPAESSESAESLKFKMPRQSPTEIQTISTKTGEGINQLQQSLTRAATKRTNPEADLIVTNARHYDALLRTNESLRRVRQAITDDLSADFISQDIREAITHLGEITGAITTDTLLQTIFSRFCIGK